MKLYKNLLILVLLTINSLKAEYLTFDLVQFANFTANQNNITILIDEDLKDKKFSFISNGVDTSLKAFRIALNLKGLKLEYSDNFYFVTPKEIYKEELKYRAIKLNFVKFEDIANFLKVYEDSIKFEFISTTKTLLIKSNAKDFKSIYDMIKNIDVLPKQLKLRVTIIDTNLDKLKEFGTDSSALNLSNNTNLFFNLVSYPFTVKNTLSSSESKGFYSFLRLLDSKGTSEFISNPTLTLSDEKQTIFDVVDNVPYLSGSTVIDEDTTKTTSSYEYKDIGTQIKVTPHIYSNNNVYLDMELNVSNILNNSDNLPTTSKKYVKQSFHLEVGKLFVLTGINKKEILHTISKVPILSEIPYLGNLFKLDSNQENKSNLTIVFELVNENDYKTDDFKIIISNIKN
jgi:general secretion pathway protein D